MGPLFSLELNASQRTRGDRFARALGTRLVRRVVTCSISRFLVYIIYATRGRESLRKIVGLAVAEPRRIVRRSCSGDEGDLTAAGAPSGAVRVSLGYCSSYEDVAAIVEFVRATFVAPPARVAAGVAASPPPDDGGGAALASSLTAPPPPPPRGPPPPLELKSIYVFPIKVWCPINR